MKFASADSPRTQASRWIGCLSWIGLLAGVLASTHATAEDWPQFRGPNGDNKSTETGLLSTWPEGGPALAWTFKNAGVGYSSPAIVDGRIYLTGGRNGKAELFCLNAKDGSELWSLPLNEKSFDFEGNAWGAGPRAAPTVDGDYVYAVAGDGQLVCASTKGEVVWKVHMVEDLGGSIKSVDAGEPETYGWGFCWGAVVDGDRLICTPGSTDGAGLVAALDKKSGKVLWRSKELDEESTYATPVIATLGGIKQYVVMTQFGIAGVAAEDGKLLWYYERSRPYSDVVIPTPFCHEDHVYASTGDGCDMVKVTRDDGGKFAAEAVYTSRNMKNSIGGFILHDGHVYGTSERRGWVCQEFMTGDIAWYQRANKSVGNGSLVMADGHLYLYGERSAEVELIEASSESWVSKGRFELPATSELTAPSGKNWTRPVISDGRLYLRDQDLVFCYRIQ
ncbi:MAG: PQQ-binding-like beta-propeller repeat protein [Planctomycetota bacterium]